MPAKQEELVESKAALLELDAAQRDHLIRVGKSLASSSRWWGSTETDERERTVVVCEHVQGKQYEVTVKDAVGAIGLPGVNLIVRPKVPLTHFLYVIAASGAIPRSIEDNVVVNPDASFWELIARWFVDSAERLVRLGLLKDYREASDVLPIARGRIRPLSTARLHYAGRVAVDCLFDDFDHDNALNRLIKAAAISVAGSPALDRELRSRATRVVELLYDVSDVVTPDLDVTTDLRALHYREPVDLAKRVLLGQGVAPRAGERGAKTFLIRTPELIEEGVRNLLADALAPCWEIERSPHGRQISGSTMTLNPDLVFEGGAVTGDIKYKLPKKWDRADLFQSVVFATGFRARRACVVHFEDGALGSHSVLPELKVGDLEITPFSWKCSAVLDPANSVQDLASEVSTWLAKAWVDDTGSPDHPYVP